MDIFIYRIHQTQWSGEPQYEHNMPPIWRGGQFKRDGSLAEKFCRKRPRANIDVAHGINFYWRPQHNPVAMMGRCRKVCRYWHSVVDTNQHIASKCCCFHRRYTNTWRWNRGTPALPPAVARGKICGAWRPQFIALFTSGEIETWFRQYHRDCQFG